MKIRTLLAAGRTRSLALLAIVLPVLGILCVANIRANAASCPPQATDYGTVTSTVNLPAAATYRVWTHMFAPDASNNTYLLQVSDQCFTIGGTSAATGAWKWVASRDGNAGLMADIALPAGNQTIKLIGNKPNVKIDRVIFAADLACVPTNDGSNCDTPADDVAPTVHLTAPTSGSTVSGTATITATASDNIGVTRVEFYVNGTLLSTDTTAPYSANWSTNGLQNGQQTIGVQAFDLAGNSDQDSYRVTVQNGDTQAPSMPANLTAKATAYNQVNLAWSASTDNIGVTGYTVLRDGVPVGTVTSGTAYTDKTVAANTAYSYQVQAYDAADNKSAASSTARVTTPTIPDTQAPTAPASLTATAISSNQINLSWPASTDNTGVVAYDIYRAQGSDSTAQKIATTQTPGLADANLSAATSYTYYVKARDGNNNQSAASPSATATTQAAPGKKHRHTHLVGTITNARTGAAIPHATISVQTAGGRQTYVANHRGKYHIRGLDPGSYRVIVQADGYKPVTVTVNASTHGGRLVKNVALTKQQPGRN